MRIKNTLKALYLMFSTTQFFRCESVFKNKRVAVIGAAASAFEEENGSFIDGFDVIVRVNKAPHAWSKEKSKYIGSRTDVLFHSFYENNISGGGSIDFELYKQQGIKYIVNPNTNWKGLITHLTYYKRNLRNKITYILPYKFHSLINRNFGKIIPTVGFSALSSVINSQCKEIYITGFTFFQTPYADDYRDHFKDMETNNEHIKNQGIHDPDLELKEFIRQLNDLKNYKEKIRFDATLERIVLIHNIKI